MKIFNISTKYVVFVGYDLNKEEVTGRKYLSRINCHFFFQQQFVSCLIATLIPTTFDFV